MIYDICAQMASESVIYFCVDGPISALFAMLDFRRTALTLNVAGCDVSDHTLHSTLGRSTGTAHIAA